jgi:beta-lactamase class A
MPVRQYRPGKGEMSDAFDWRLVEAATATAALQGGLVGVAVRWQGDSWTRRGDRRFRAASTIKIAVMIELFRQFDAGRHLLDDVSRLGRADRTPGSGVLQHFHEGIALTLDDLCTLMIAISDNTATNVLIDRVRMDNVNASIAALVTTGTVLGRKMLGRRANDGDPENWTTPDDLAAMVAAICERTAATEESCARMEAMLSRQDQTRRVTRYAPGGSRWGSKPGTLPGVVNDVGFVQTAEGTLIVAVCCEGFADEGGAERAIAEIARAAMMTAGLLPTGAG